MSIFETLSLDVAEGREEPAVWVSNLMIYARIEPQRVLVREVPLQRGLNIVWAEEPDGDDASAEIRGHSAGKTSFCRLLRYVLGEKNYATAANAKLITRCFPRGYVAAEMHVKGRTWAVIRPFDKTFRSYAIPDATINQLLEARDRGGALSQDDYIQTLGLSTLLDGLHTGSVVRTGQPIEWGHMLAWCTRDQEARFQNIHEWRSPRSDSGWSPLQADRADALFVMRVLLGLFMPNELNGEQELANSQKELDRITKLVEKLKAEPQFRVNLYDQSLRRQLRGLMPERSDIDEMPLHHDLLEVDLSRLTEDADKALKDEIKQLESGREAMQEEINDEVAELKRLKADRQRLDSIFGVQTVALGEIRTAISERQQQREKYREIADQSCLYGGVLFRECVHIQKQQDDLTIRSAQDAHAAEQAEAARRDAQRRLAERQRPLDEQITDSEAWIAGRRDELKGNGKQLQDAQNRLASLQATWTGLDEWIRKSRTPGEFKDLDAAKNNLVAAEETIAKLISRLSKQSAQHDVARDRLQQIFDAAVQSVLAAGSYKGEVSLKDRELQFGITHGATMSGEAVETLSVLLADLACVVYTITSAASALPGFLMHDSPREADLGLRLYHLYLRAAAALHEHFGRAKQPFQYVVTTTTSPPKELRNSGFVKLHLNAATKDGLLFCQSISEPAIENVQDSSDSNGLWEK
jgi:hypothetical protein